ncbi:MAG: ATP-dependent DNA helicase [Chitinophagales bacterium]|jgi:ATP-dependent DNA helicase RecQ|nr:ATP-dependent DNA helicase [Chitinophagales bacterium]
MQLSSKVFNLEEELKKHFGFSEFKSNQKDIILSLLAGVDTFVLMPTGGGKSMCYQLPGLILPGTAVIVSPLIALMKNQVDLIRSYSNDDEIAHFYNSTLNLGQKRHVEEMVLQGRTKLIYVAPETLAKEDNAEFFHSVNVSFFAVDEAHCISEWGHDFRPEYRKLRETINKLPKKVPIIALTATATPKVQHDIIKNLELENHVTFVTSFNRPNLYYEIKYKVNDTWAIKNMVQFIKTHPNKSGIVYVLNRKSAEDIAKIFNENGIKAQPYHAGLEGKYRNQTQEAFIKDEIQVIVATVAFGMGIDKPDIRFVIHFNIAKSIENYYQETGRAGRDNLEGICVAYFNYKDISQVEGLLNKKNVTEKERSMLLIDETVAYIEDGGCRRKFLLNYFGQNYDSTDCTDRQMCDNCRNPKEHMDAQEQMVLALQNVRECKESVKINHLTSVLLGDKNDAVVAYNHHNSKYFGKGKDLDNLFWTSIYRNAIIHGLVYREIEEFGTLKMTAKGYEYLENPYPIKVYKNHDYQANAGVVFAHGHSATFDKALFDILKSLTRDEAKKSNLPPYVIIPDVSLEEMCLKYPITEEEFANIIGINQTKAKKYAPIFTKIISEYVIANEIERPSDLTVKSIANKSSLKPKIINAIDKKISIEDLANQLKITYGKLVEEIESIALSGTKIDVRYFLNEIMDEELIDEIYDFFAQNESGDIKECHKCFIDDDLPLEDIHLVKCQFISDHIA